MKMKNSVYKFIDIEDQFNIENLKNNEVLCKYFEDFNDAYEGHFGVTTIWPCPYRETEKLKALISLMAPESADTNTKSVNHMVDFIDKNNHLNRFVHDFLYQEIEHYRVCSFTRRWNHILMWSHYSKGGRGAVLVFDADKLVVDSYAHELDSNVDLDGDNLPLKWVNYKNIPPLVNAVDVFESVKVNSPILRKKMNDELIQKCILTKFKTWKYEQESRLVVKLATKIDKRPILFKYQEEALSGVLVGNKCKEESYISIANSVRDDVKIYLACQSSSRYKYEITHEYLAKDIKSGKVVINKEIK
jgi:hypothetical protein